ncbi:MAG: 4'-phosphopantetheinyl transferase family protein [Longimicrobiales bacterium]
MVGTAIEFHLSPGIVYLREASLKADPAALYDMRAVLSEVERNRADRFRFDRHRRRFTVAHWVLRTELGRVLGRSPQTLHFELGEYGKPHLEGGPAFNMSHSGDRMLLGVTATGRLGVDIEEHRPVREMEDLAEKKFAPDEAALLLATPAAEQEELFFRIWTRKEAYLKALGRGLSLSLASFSVDPEPHAEQALIRLETPGEALDGWQLKGLEVPGRAEAAVALDVEDFEVQRLVGAAG